MRFMIIVIMAASMVAAEPARPASVDLVVMSSEAAQHSALFAQPETSLPLPATKLTDVSDAILKLLQLDEAGGSILERRPPRALLTVVVGGLAPQMLNIDELPQLSAILDSSSKSYIRAIPEPRDFDNMLKTAFTTNGVALNEYIQSALHDRAQLTSWSSSESACRLFHGCQSAPGSFDKIASLLNGALDNNILTFTGSSGRTFQLDSSDEYVQSFLEEVAMVLTARFRISDSASPSLYTIAFFTLQPVLNEHGIRSNVASGCFAVLDAVVPRVLELFRTAYPDRAEIALLLLPPSHDAYITEEIRRIIASVNGAESQKNAAFVQLSDRTPDDADLIRERLSAGLPADFKVLSIGEQKANKMDPNPALYQITLWVSIMLVILVIISAGVLCCGDTRKDTLLYSKITPSIDKKNR